MADVHRFYHKQSTLVAILVLLSVFLGLLILAVTVGSGFGAGSWNAFVAGVFALLLAGGIAVVARLLIRRPPVLELSDEGLFFPMTYRRPLRWDEVHRIRRETAPRHLVYGARDWLVVDPLPGVLAPLKWPVWRKAELWLQRQQGVRIPLHGLEGDPEDVLRVIEQFRPVARSE